MHDFIVTSAQFAGRRVITVTGDIDLQTCTELAHVTAAVPFDETLHLDLAGVPFMDSSGLHLILDLRRRLQAEGGQLSLVGLRDQPTHLLQLTGSDELLIACEPDDEIRADSS
ncbi:STAS domain-containing protein [Streptomyces olivaceus]|uniref:STAS domain-containing protein n=1 Tax=Streptomyces olivaceus TaxID=47716 RepID=UPI00363A1885